MINKKVFLFEIKKYIASRYVSEHKERNIYFKPYVCGDDLTSEFKNLSKNNNETWSQKVFEFANEKALDSVDIYKKGYISKQTFSKINSNDDYKPSKDTAYQMCIGLELNLDESLELMALAGHTLSLGNYRDLCLRYCLENQIYDIDLINYSLDQLGFPLLANTFYKEK